MTHATKQQRKRISPEIKEAIRSAGSEISNLELSRKYGVSNGYVSSLRALARQSGKSVDKRKTAKHEAPDETKSAHANASLSLQVEMTETRANSIWNTLGLDEKVTAIRGVLLRFLECA